MFRHRLALEADYYRLPELPPPSLRPGGFALCTVAVDSALHGAQWAGLQQVYIQAFEHAVTALRPTVHDRGLYSFWN